MLHLVSGGGAPSFPMFSYLLLLLSNVSDQCSDQPQSCNDRGDCYGSGDSAVCVCQDGYYGLECQFEGRDACDVLNHCHGHGECSYRTDGFGNCSCNIGYDHETSCEDLIPFSNACQPSNGRNPCKNGGNCTAFAPDQYRCECPPGKCVCGRVPVEVTFVSLPGNRLCRKELHRGV